MAAFVTVPVLLWVLRSVLLAVFVLDHLTLARRLRGAPWPARLLLPAPAGWRAGHRALAASWWVCLAGWTTLGLLPTRWFDSTP